MSLVPVPELRELVTAAKAFVAGDVHFSNMVEPADRCAFWAKVHGLHPSIVQLAVEWNLLADRAWNEYGQYAQPCPSRSFANASHVI